MAGPPPPFVEHHPEVWIIQLDMYFSRVGLTDETLRFQTAFSQLPAHRVMDFVDFVRKPPTNPYTKLCDALKARLGSSEEEQLRKVLEAQELGERKPSQFLRHLQELTTPWIQDADSPLVRQIFLKAMPENVKPLLQFLPPETTLETLAGTADRVLSSFPRNSPVVRAIEPSAAPCNCRQALENKQELETIKRQLRAIQATLNKLTVQRGRSNSRKRNTFPPVPKPPQVQKKR